MGTAKVNPSTVLLSILVAAAVSFSAVMCLVDAFALGCDPTVLLAVCGGGALIATCAMLPRRTWLMTLGGAVLYLAALIWQRPVVEESLQGFLYQVTSEFAMCYRDVTVTGYPADCLPLVAALSLPLAWITARVVCREGNAMLVLVACLPVLILCLIIVDVAPVRWLVLLSAVLLLLLLTNGAREHSSREGSRLAWWLVLPTVILVTAVTAFWPPAEYTRADWSTVLQAAAEKQFSVETIQEELFSDLPKWNRDLKKVDLSQVGPKSMTGRAALESQAPEDSYYLRSVSLGVYEDNAWEAIPQQEYIARQFTETPSVQGSGLRTSLNIRTRTPEETIYTPYYTAQVSETARYVDDAYVKNQDRLTEYAVDYWFTATGGGTIPDGYETFVQDYYTRVPDDLKQALTALLAERGWNTVASASELADCVRQSAAYDLNTPRLPEGEDFVLYFLQQSRRGYCVHFATATAMLLRTMGIPARYVTGYLVQGAPGAWVTVTQDDAHAWVEYWVSGLGWVPLDPTPAGTNPDPEPQPEPAPEEPDQPTPDQEPEQTSEPEQTTLQEPDQPELPGALPLGDGGSTVSSAWWWLLALPGLVLAVWLRRRLVLRSREDRCSRGNPNRQALSLWRWISQLDRANGAEPEEDLLNLAEKARFSQHTLTEEELEHLREGLDRRIALRKNAGSLGSFWDRYGRVLY